MMNLKPTRLYSSFKVYVNNSQGLNLPLKLFTVVQIKLFMATAEI